MARSALIAVIDACEETNAFKFLFDLEILLFKRIELIAKFF